ncbi:MAG: HEPN domain-containing protein [Deltaproteobacteria bacterium]|nr:HEPN domain-containing protein [Deltaproteobacteria bacterium]
MNAANRLANARDELERARRTLRGAELMLREGIPEEAVSSAYYAGHHAARALLFSVGLEVRSHEGLRNRIGEFFGRKGTLSPALVHGLKKAYEARLDADYEVSVQFTADQAAGWVAWARDFVAAADVLLAPSLTPPADGGASKAGETRVAYRPSISPAPVPSTTSGRARKSSPKPRRAPRPRSLARTKNQ